MKNLLIILSISSILAACSGGNKDDKKVQLAELKKQQAELTDKISQLEADIAKNDTTKSGKSKLVIVTGIEPKPFNHYIEVQARVEGDEDVMVSAESMGAVTAVNVKAGDKVSKGQVMATLDDRTIRSQMESMQSQLELATTLYNRQKNLWDQKIGSEVQFLNAKTQKESLERQVGALQNQWDLTRIKSPINGTVDDINIKIGQMMAPGMPAIRVVNLTSLKVKGEVAEAYINSVNKGNPVKIFFPDLNKEIDAKVDYSGKAIGALNRTFNVEVRLNAAHGEYHPNQVAVLKIADYSSEKALVVPVSAVMKGTDGEYVFIAANENGKNIAKRKPVKSGKVYNGNVEIAQGISANDKVITFGNQNLVEGDIISF